MGVDYDEAVGSVTCSAMNKFLTILPTLYWEVPEKRMSFFCPAVMESSDGIERYIEQGWFLIDPQSDNRGLHEVYPLTR